MHILIELDGVLMGRLNDEPIIPGILLTGQLSAYNQISFFTSMEPKAAHQWLDVNGIVDFDNLYDSSCALVGEDLKQRQILVARSRGSVELVITADPNVWVYAFDQGIPAMMFGVPSYLRPEFRPDAPKKIRSWDKIEEAIQQQRAIRTQDARLNGAESVTFE